MQIVISKSSSEADKAIINNAIKAAFQAKGVEIDSFSASRTLFISTLDHEKSDYHFSMSNFLNGNNSFKLIVLKNLAQAIFSEYVDPRVIMGKYQALQTEDTKPVEISVNSSIDTNTSSKIISSTETIKLPEKAILTSGAAPAKDQVSKKRFTI